MCTKLFKKKYCLYPKNVSFCLTDFFFWLLLIFVVVVFVLNYLDRDPNSELLPLSEWCEIYFFINILFPENFINKSFSKNTSMFLKGFWVFSGYTRELCNCQRHKISLQFGCMLCYSVFSDLNQTTEMIQK